MRELPDPRTFPPPRQDDSEVARLQVLADASLTATTGAVADAHDAAIAAAIRDALRGEGGVDLAALLEGAPSVAIHRHLWRAIAREAGVAHAGADAIAALAFAVPVVIVVGTSGGEDIPRVVPGVLPDPGSLAAVLREHGALAGNATLAFANALVGASAIDYPELPALLAAMCPRGQGAGPPAPALAPSPMEIVPGERAHLRFVVGRALAAPGAELLRDTGALRWQLPFARTLTTQLAMPGVSLLALPKAALSLPAAVAAGRAAQREVSAQLFASSAIRSLRASFGEPSAVLSAHVALDAPGGGELRLSLSSPLSPRDAAGFRCPLYPGERVQDVAAMLLDLMRDFRVGDVHVLAGVHPDRAPLTGGPLLFKPETIPPAHRTTVQ